MYHGAPPNCDVLQEKLREFRPRQARDANGYQSAANENRRRIGHRRPGGESSTSRKRAKKENKANLVCSVSGDFLATPISNCFSRSQYGRCPQLYQTRVVTLCSSTIRQCILSRQARAKLSSSQKTPAEKVISTIGQIPGTSIVHSNPA